MPSGTAWSTEPDEREASVPVVVPSRTNGNPVGRFAARVARSTHKELYPRIQMVGV